MPHTQAQKDLEAFRRAKEKRGLRESTWDNFTDFVLPLKEFRRTRSPGQLRFRRVFDSTAPRGLSRFASNMHGLLMNPAIKWFHLRVKNDVLDAREDIRRWMEDSTNRMFSVLNSSELQFNTNAHEVLIEVGGFGTGALFMREDIAQRRIMMMAIPLKELYLEVDGEGKVNTAYREPMLNGQQALDRWKDKLPKRTRDDAIKNPDKEFTFLHVVRPRRERNATLPNALNMPFESRWLDMQTKEIIEESGFRFFPYLTPRWERLALEPYGIGPTEKIFSSILVANSMKRTNLRGIQKAVDPVLVSKHSDVLAKIRTSPSSVIPVRDVNSVKALDQGARPDAGFQFLEIERADIKEGYFLDLFDIPELDRMTATEINARLRNQMTVLSPQVSRLQSEFLSPLVVNLFNVMFDMGAFAPPPQDLSGQEFDVDFVSPLSLAQKASEVDNILQWRQAVEPFLQIDPSMLAINMNLDMAARHMARLLNVPRITMRTDEEVAQARAQQAEQQQQAAQAEIAEMETKAAKQGADALAAIQ